MSSGHCEWTLLMAFNPEALDAGLGSYRKPTGAKNSAQGTDGALQASMHEEEAACQGGRAGGLGAWGAWGPKLHPSPPGGQGVWGREISYEVDTVLVSGQKPEFEAPVPECP